jgi:hypothetical protein
VDWASWPAGCLLTGLHLAVRDQMEAGRARLHHDLDAGHVAAVVDLDEAELLLVPQGAHPTPQLDGLALVHRSAIRGALRRAGSGVTKERFLGVGMLQIGRRGG